MIELEAGTAYLTIDAEAGGRLVQLEVAGTKLLKDDRSGGDLTWGSYPMAPWAGRVRLSRTARYCAKGARSLCSSAWAWRPAM